MYAHAGGGITDASHRIPTESLMYRKVSGGIPTIPVGYARRATLQRHTDRGLTVLRKYESLLLPEDERDSYSGMTTVTGTERSIVPSTLTSAEPRGQPHTERTKCERLRVRGHDWQ